MSSSHLRREREGQQQAESEKREASEEAASFSSSHFPLCISLHHQFHSTPILSTNPLTRYPPGLCYHTKKPSIHPTYHLSTSTSDRFLIFLNISHVPKVFLIHPRFFPPNAAAGAEITLPTTKTTGEEAERGRRRNIRERGAEVVFALFLRQTKKGRFAEKSGIYT